MSRCPPRRDDAPWCDFAFEVAGERISLHRAVLAARSPFFRRMLLSDWRATVPALLPGILRDLHAVCSVAVLCASAPAGCSVRHTSGLPYCGAPWCTM